MPVRHMGRRLTPSLCGLAAGGGWAAQGGRAVLPSSTYPNHATFVTGVEPALHGIHGNHVVDASGARPAHDVGISRPTVFDTCRAAGLHTAAVLGDHHLVSVMGATGAGTHWPPEGELPPGTPADLLGYATDDAVLEPLRRAIDTAPDLLVAHLNAPDTAGHVHGPDSQEAAAQYRATDAVLGLVLDALAPRWDEWLVIVVSDHDQETVTNPEPIDLAAALGPDVLVVPEGGSALVRGPADGLDELAGVAGHRPLGPDLTEVWATRGRWFGSDPVPIKGVHGSPRQDAQLAVCGGGHPTVSTLAARLHARRPVATEWAAVLTEAAGVRAGR